MTQIRVRTRAAEPAGSVYLMYFDSAGWQQPAMIGFLDSVRVADDAVALP